MEHILVTGGTGFIGKALLPRLTADGAKVTVLTRYPEKQKQTAVDYIDSLNQLPDETQIDAVINLAGANISHRWTSGYKKTLIDSRIQTTQAVIDLIRRLEKKPALLISASAIGYYGSQPGVKLDEQSVPQDEFTHQLCHQWEAVANQANAEGVRVCIARLGVVLGPGGALQKMLPAFQLGLGTVLGSGEQSFSWVHRQDVLNALTLFMRDQTTRGVYNVVAPGVVNNHDFTHTLASVLKRPSFLSLPKPLIRCLFGEMGEVLLLGSQHVIAKRLLEGGFSFEFPSLEQALRDIIRGES